MNRQLTFDQIQSQHPNVDPLEEPEVFNPHKAIEARLVIEPHPAQGHVRITARSASNELLWGVMASPRMLRQHPVEVAFYTRLIEEAEKHLPAKVEPRGTATIDQVLADVSKLRNSLDRLEKELSPQKVSDATEKKAMAASSNVRDALRLLNRFVSQSDGNENV